MFLDSPSQTLEVLFRVKHGDGSYMVYASSGQLKCFECGDVGHKHVACPQKRQQEVNVSPVARAAYSGAVDGVGPDAAVATDITGGAVAASGAVPCVTCYRGCAGCPTQCH